MAKKTPGFWGSLVRSNTGVSSLNFYVIGTTITGICLLALVIFAIIWEVVHQNAVMSDLSGWAAFIGAVSTLFATAGISKSWSNWSENKFKSNENTLEDQIGMVEEDTYNESEYTETTPQEWNNNIIKNHKRNTRKSSNKKKE